MNKHKDAEGDNTNFNTTNYNANNDIPPNYDAATSGLLDNRANVPTTHTHPSAPNIGWDNPSIPSESSEAPPPVVIYVEEDYGHHGWWSRRGRRGGRGGRGGRGRLAGRGRWGRRHFRMYNMDQVPPEYVKCVRISQFIILGVAFIVIIGAVIVAICLIVRK